MIEKGKKKIELVARATSVPPRPLIVILISLFLGSVFEFVDFIPLLNSGEFGNKDFVFEIVVPSLPGYGFSSAAAKPGLDLAQTARIFRRLMTERLGFDKFYTQGGDWGSGVTSNLAVLYPERWHKFARICLNPLKSFFFLLASSVSTST